MKLYPPIKRLADILVSASLLLMLSPLLLLTALFIKITSPGPVFFVQLRGGHNGRHFTIYKFRSMRVEHKHDPTEFMPLDNPNITTFGRIIRRTKIDELPQLFNVLIGDMSLIGPRPTLIEQIERYNELERRRLNVRPGCTGLAQVNGSTALSWPERIEWDVHYVNHLSPWLDLAILIKTVGGIILGEPRFQRRHADVYKSNTRR